MNFELVKILHDATATMSSPAQMARTKEFKDILNEGNVAVPYLLEDLKREPTVVVMTLLHTITDEDPVMFEHRGFVKEMAQDWVKFLEKKYALT